MDKTHQNHPLLKNESINVHNVHHPNTKRPTREGECPHEPVPGSTTPAPANHPTPTKIRPTREGECPHEPVPGEKAPT
jgi:hypothetical protein